MLDEGSPGIGIDSHVGFLSASEGSEMELRIRVSESDKAEIERLLRAQKVPFESIDHAGLDATQAIEFVLTWGPPLINLVEAIYDFSKKLKKDKKARISIDLTDD
jgi:hypothetical protein